MCATGKEGRTLGSRQRSKNMQNVRFCQVEDEYVNVDTIASVIPTGGGALRVVFKDGRTAAVDSHDGPHTADDIMGAFSICSIHPVEHQRYLVFKTGDEITVRTVNFYGVMADGSVQPLISAGGGLRVPRLRQCIIEVSESSTSVRSRYPSAVWADQTQQG